MEPMHATSVSLDGQGVLIRGPSGSGKSDLALRLIHAGANLVADDQTEVLRRSDKLLLNPPKTIAGKIEIRGFGILELPYDQDIPLHLIVDIKDREKIERMPETQFAVFMDQQVALLQISAFDASAVAKINLIIKELGR